MQPRILLEVALRLLGLWMVFDSLVGLIAFLSLIPSLMNQAPGTLNYLTSVGIWSVAKAAIGGFALVAAPRISARFYPVETCKSETSPRIGAGDLYHIACFVLGTYFVVHGLLLTAQTMLGMSTGMPADRLLQMFLTFSIYVGSGLLLVFGGRQIAQWMASLEYDPDSIPQQRFSIRMLLVFTVIVALILGFIRVATM